VRTFLSDSLRRTPVGREADEILRSCVHCGFCNATCPTYQVLGDERDGPRGRIYLIKEMLENNAATRETQHHLDRCLTCRACETTCPSGVQYNRLLEIGRAAAESSVKRPLTERLQREFILRTVPRPALFRQLLSLAGLFRPLLPVAVKKVVPESVSKTECWPETTRPRKVLLLEGCVQPVTAPRINLAAAKILDRLGIQAIPATGCCGALSHHLSREEKTLATVKSNIDLWWPLVEAGAEAIILTASGCAPTVGDYGRLLEWDRNYAERAQKISALSHDISAFLEREDLGQFANSANGDQRIVFHSPCTLQHGLKRAGRVETLLEGLGFNLNPVQDAHLCCGSAGSYSILQKKLSQQLLAAKIEKLEEGEPAVIATANIGCLMHLQSGTGRPVKHWIELLDQQSG
jgi:glycolate oxidase iron-sulfur subunit